VGAGDRGHDRGGVHVHDALVGGVGVGGERPPGVRAPLLDQELARGRVAGDEPGLGARLDGHVAEREPAGHGQRVDARPTELERLVGGPVGAQRADEREHEVLGLHAVVELAGDLDAERLGHAQPRPAADHAHGHIGAAHAGGEGAQGAGHAGVRVGADHEVSGLGEALGDALVAHPHLDVAERGAEGRAEGPDRLLCVGQLAARRRSGVIDEEDAGGRLERLGAELLDLLDRERAGAVLRDRDVHRGNDDLPRRDGVHAGVRGEDLLGQSERGHAGVSAVAEEAAPPEPSPMGTASPSRPR